MRLSSLGRAIVIAPQLDWLKAFLLTYEEVTTTAFGNKWEVLVCGRLDGAAAMNAANDMHEAWGVRPAIFSAAQTLAWEGPPPGRTAFGATPTAVGSILELKPRKTPIIFAIDVLPDTERVRHVRAFGDVFMALPPGTPEAAPRRERLSLPSLATVRTPSRSVGETLGDHMNARIGRMVRDSESLPREQPATPTQAVGCTTGYPVIIDGTQYCVPLNYRNAWNQAHSLGPTARARLRALLPHAEMAHRRYPLIPTSLLVGIAWRESRANPTAIGRHGSQEDQGAFQLREITSRELGVDPFNLRDSTFAAARLLNGYVTRFDREFPNDPERARLHVLSAYGQGVGNLRRRGLRHDERDRAVVVSRTGEYLVNQITNRSE